jgi:hypothetical protein
VKNAGSDSGTNYRTHKEGIVLVSQMIFTLATYGWHGFSKQCLVYACNFWTLQEHDKRCALQTSTKFNLSLRNSEILKCVESSDTAYGLE